VRIGLIKKKVAVVTEMGVNQGKWGNEIQIKLFNPQKITAK